MTSELKIPLESPADVRWTFDAQHAAWAVELVRLVTEEIGGSEPYRQELELFAAECLPPELAAEIESVARQVDCEFYTALAANLYYDFFKGLLGCTAFAVKTPDGPLLARNMDWFSHSNRLSEFTTIMDFVGRDGDARFRSVGWPGYVGVLSGLAPGRFALTLNAVLSDEPMQLGHSAALLIREVCQRAPDFRAAVDWLCNEPCTSDFLLLVVGTKPDEMVVIERTPSRHAVRRPDADYIVVTNDYRALVSSNVESSGDIYATACRRFDATTTCLGSRLPTNAAECFAVLDHDDVKMTITVQQMVMSPGDGALDVRTAHDTPAR